MYMTQPDRQRIQHIRDYCEEIRKTIERYGEGFAAFDQDADYQRSIAFSIHPALLRLRRTVARNERFVCTGVDLPSVRRRPRQGRERRKEHFERRAAPVGAANMRGRAGHARTYTLVDTV